MRRSVGSADEILSSAAATIHLRLDEDKLSKMVGGHPLGEDKLSLSKDQLQLNEDERPFGEDKLSLSEDQLLLGGDKLSEVEDERSLGEAKLSMSGDQLLLDEDKRPLAKDKLSLDVDKLLKVEDERLLGGGARARFLEIGTSSVLARCGSKGVQMARRLIFKIGRLKAFFLGGEDNF